MQSQKKSRYGSFDEETVEKEIHKSVGMECASGAGAGAGADVFDINIEQIKETILTRINQAITDTSGNSATSGSDSSGQSFVREVVPAIVTTVAVAVGEVLRSVFAKLTMVKDNAVVAQRLQRNLILARYRADSLEQYGRREIVRIVGMKEEEEEDVEGKVLKIFKDAGAEVDSSDISVVHRTGPKSSTARGRGPRPILVKFVSRRKKREVMMKKKELKGKTGYKDVYLNDDLTSLRAKLFSYVKRSKIFGSVWTVDGKILCTKKQPVGLHSHAQRPPPFVIESPDDLFAAGFSDVDFAELGLADLFCV
nr:hypothetical protein BaRGS_029888 [Batillaria attramentaria]